MPETSGEFLKMMLDLAWFLELALSTSGWVILRYSSNKKLPWYRLLAEFLILYAVMIGADIALVVITFPSYYFSIFWVITEGAIALAYLWKFSEYEHKNMLLLWLAFYTSMLSVISMAGMCSLLVGNFISPGRPEGIVRSAVYFLIPIVAWILGRYNFSEYADVPKSGVRMLLYGTVCVLLLYVVEARIAGTDYRIYVALLVAYLCMFTMTMTSIRALHVLAREHSRTLDLQAEKQRYQAEKEMTRMTESKLEDLRCIRHDLKNQYAYMQILLKEGRYGDLQLYFAKLSENLPEQLSMIDCGNHTMNTVLNMELAKLRSDRITVEHQLVVPPVLPFPDRDICAVVTNLLDNAADECRRLLKNGKSAVKVRFEIYPRQSYLFIKCINTTDRTEINRARGGIRTTKKDESLHGYGTRIVMKLAEKYNGCADYAIEDGKFIAQVMLDMTEDKKHED